MFVEKHWTPINAAALLGDGSVSGILHRVEDVTANQGKILQDEAGRLGLEILAQARRLAGANDFLLSNEGMPIPEDVLPTLFEPFRRGPGSGSASQRAHMGLGLFIVMQIADAHGASVAVESTLYGTHFTMRLPTQPSFLGIIDGASAHH